MRILTLLLLLFSVLYGSPFIEPAKKARTATVLIHADEKKEAGFLITADGLIVTLYHLIQEVTNPLIVSLNHHYYPATLLQGDTKTDLVFLKIEGNHFPYVELASSRDLLVGEWVLTAGYPMRRFAVRTAIIAGYEREYLLTNIPFNPGEFGGPLLNLQGEAVGIIFANAEGLGLAIPSEWIISICHP